MQVYAIQILLNLFQRCHNVMHDVQKLHFEPQLIVAIGA